MRSEFAVVVLGMLLVTAGGCDFAARRRPRGVKVTQARIIEEGEGESSEADEILRRIEAQQEALETTQTEPTPEVEPQATTAAQPDETPAQPPGEPVVQPDELTVDYFVGLLQEKQELTAAELKAYRRLLGLDDASGDSAGGPAEELLDAARNALARGDAETAQAQLSEALVILRRRTDPTIDRLFFAREVRSYGNADVIENPHFSSGQLVLAVTDISNFACEEVGGAESGALYRTKMTYRLAVYDKGGQLFWQHSEGPFEYQASARISSMFLPKKFTLPRGLKPGQYVMKVEVVDHLAGRQTEASTEFTLR